MAFPDPARPIATCSALDCTDCPVAADVHCHFRPKDLFHFLLISLPCFIVGGAAVLGFGVWPLVGWIAVVVGFFGFLEIRVMCSHCPHYAEPGGALGCWANHGSPKLWRYRPGPMSLLERAVFLGGLAAVWGYPLVLLVIGRSWFLLVVFVLTSSAFFATLKMFLCSKCMNFACPLNGVGEAERELFLERNPAVSDAWRRSGMP